MGGATPPPPAVWKWRCGLAPPRGGQGGGEDPSALHTRPPLHLDLHLPGDAEPGSDHAQVPGPREKRVRGQSLNPLACSPIKLPGASTGLEGAPGMVGFLSRCWAPALPEAGWAPGTRPRLWRSTQGSRLADLGASPPASLLLAITMGSFSAQRRGPLGALHCSFPRWGSYVGPPAPGEDLPLPRWVSVIDPARPAWCACTQHPVCPQRQQCVHAGAREPLWAAERAVRAPEPHLQPGRAGPPAGPAAPAGALAGREPLLRPRPPTLPHDRAAGPAAPAEAGQPGYERTRTSCPLPFCPGEQRQRGVWVLASTLCPFCSTTQTLTAYGTLALHTPSCLLRTPSRSPIFHSRDRGGTVPSTDGGRGAHSPDCEGPCTRAPDGPSELQ